MSEAGATDSLLRLLGPEGLAILADRYAGTRLFVPESLDRTKLADEVGMEIATKLVQRYGRDYIPVPLVRDLRARHYRAAGMSNAKIARRLGITEASVNRIFQRMDNVPEKGSADPRQPSLFD